MYIGDFILNSEIMDPLKVIVIPHKFNLETIKPTHYLDTLFSIPISQNCWIFHHRQLVLLLKTSLLLAYLHVTLPVGNSIARQYCKLEMEIDFFDTAGNKVCETAI